MKGHSNAEKGVTPFKNTRGLWKHHLLRSVEYELTVIEGDEFKFKQKKLIEQGTPNAAVVIE